MNLEIFSDNLEHLFDTPNSVDYLRELILTLAIRGKLVPQNPNDEPAFKLIIKINSKKEHLITEKKIRSPKLLPPIESHSIPFQIPENWHWVRLGNVGQIIGGGTPKTNHPEYFVENGIPWLTPADLYKRNEKFIIRGKRDISELGLKKSSAQLMPAGTVIFSSRAPIGYVVIASNKLTTNQGFKSCIPFVMDMNEYIYYFLKFAGKEIDRNASGTTFKEVSGKKVSHILLPLPPLNEQKQIVAKVDQLMALCDQLEARQQKKHEQRIRLNNAALDKLLTAPTPEEFAQYWQRICDNFDLLYDVPETVGQLREAILQLAVQGKLVAQDEGDEPASVLLERIKGENEMLIKKLKVFTSIKEEILPFVLPNYWEWTRLGEIAEITMGNSPPGNTYNEKGEGVPLINGPVEFSKGPFGLTKKSKFTTKPTKFCEEADLLICVRGSTTGRTNVAGFKACIGRGVAAIRSKVYQPYINYFILSMRQQIYDLGTGSTFPSISQKHLVSFLVPLPPFEEQQRIVAKVEQLMALCDELEAGLVQAQIEGGKLMEAVVHHVLAT